MSLQIPASNSIPRGGQASKAHLNSLQGGKEKWSCGYEVTELQAWPHMDLFSMQGEFRADTAVR